MKCKKTIRGGGGGKKEEEDDDDDNDRERGRRREALAKTKQTKRERERGATGDISYLPPGVDFWAAPNIFLIKSIAVTRG